MTLYQTCINVQITNRKQSLNQLNIQLTN